MEKGKDIFENQARNTFFVVHTYVSAPKLLHDRTSIVVLETIFHRLLGTYACLELTERLWHRHAWKLR
jgi:hypothetical protein